MIIVVATIPLHHRLFFVILIVIPLARFFVIPLARLFVIPLARLFVIPLARLLVIPLARLFVIPRLVRGISFMRSWRSRTQPGMTNHSLRKKCGMTTGKIRSSFAQMLRFARDDNGVNEE